MSVAVQNKHLFFTFNLQRKCLHNDNYTPNKRENSFKTGKTKKITFFIKN